MSLLKLENTKFINWIICQNCQGNGKKKQRISKKEKFLYEFLYAQFLESNQTEIAPELPKSSFVYCNKCKGSGLIQANNVPIPLNATFPHVAIIGGGIGGMALAIACLHRGIPFTLFERDLEFNSRSQGYGLTLQQASNALKSLGISNLKDGVISTKHVVHTTDGTVIGEWGMRKWVQPSAEKSSKRTNIHIARQALRLAFFEQLSNNENVNWNHQLINCKKINKNEVELQFQVNKEIRTIKTNLVVGADGIRSSVRKLIIGEQKAPLRYLGCIVILGICPINEIKNIESDLLDSATVFQTANGNERIYVMPYDSNSVMWQLSFPMSEQDAKELSYKGAKALKQEAILRTNWHDPIPQIIKATHETQISGYPVYDRELLTSDVLENANNTTLIGDAAHPMSPFKGQGANQAILDAISLARKIYTGCKSNLNWREKGIKETVLKPFETEMILRSAEKVQKSHNAATFLHSDNVLFVGNETRKKN